MMFQAPPSAARRIELFSNEVQQFFSVPFTDPNQFFNLTVAQQRMIARYILLERPDANSNSIGWAIWANTPGYSFFTITIVPPPAAVSPVSPYAAQLVPSLFSSTTPI
jgi:hypothetical protein